MYTAPRFLEQWVGDSCDKPIVSALWLSNMRREDISASACTLPVCRARQLAEDLCGEATKIEKALTEHVGKVVVVWAPVTNVHLNQMMAGLKKVIVRGKIDVNLLVVSPREPFTGD